MVQKAQASKFKPHLWNNEDLWKKIEYFKYWKPPCNDHIVSIFAEISSEPSKPSGLLFGLTRVEHYFYSLNTLWTLGFESRCTPKTPFNHLWRPQKGPKQDLNLSKFRFISTRMLFFVALGVHLPTPYGLWVLGLRVPLEYLLHPKPKVHNEYRLYR